MAGNDDDVIDLLDDDDDQHTPSGDEDGDDDEIEIVSETKKPAATAASFGAQPAGAGAAGQLTGRCRFCGAGTGTSAAGTAAICSKPPCKEQAKEFCNLVHGCGHACGGIAAEELVDGDSCLPCLVAGCSATTAAVGSGAGAGASSSASSSAPAAASKRLSLPSADDMCVICGDSYGANPCIQLDCGHVHHDMCVKGQLNATWTGTRITFNFMGCALCKQPINHWSLDDVLKPLTELKKRVEDMAVRRVEVEGLWPPKDQAAPAEASSSSAAGAGSRAAAAVGAIGAAAAGILGGAMSLVGSAVGSGGGSKRRRTDDAISAATASSSSSASAAPAPAPAETADAAAVHAAKLEIGLAKLSYYLCSKCDKPYFGGLYACEASSGGDGGGDCSGDGASASSGTAVNVAGGGKTRKRRGAASGASSSSSQQKQQVEEYICPGCTAPRPGQPGSVVCAKHGTEDLVYKCKWCCAVATHFCRGLNRYCDRCVHQSWVIDLIQFTFL